MWLTAWWLLCYLRGQATLTPDSSVYLSQSVALSSLRHLSGALCALSQLPQLICKPIFMEDVICILQEFWCNHVLSFIVLYTWDGVD